MVGPRNSPECKRFLRDAPQRSVTAWGDTMHLIDEEEDAPAGAFALWVGGGQTPLSPLAQARIGAELRAMYADLRDEPLPDRLVWLAEQLERKCRERLRGH